jgi:hypothetical protein
MGSYGLPPSPMPAGSRLDRERNLPVRCAHSFAFITDFRFVVWCRPPGPPHAQHRRQADDDAVTAYGRQWHGVAPMGPDPHGSNTVPVVERCRPCRLWSLGLRGLQDVGGQVGKHR